MPGSRARSLPLDSLEQVHAKPAMVFLQCVATPADLFVCRGPGPAPCPQTPCTHMYTHTYIRACRRAGVLPSPVLFLVRNSSHTLSRCRARSAVGLGHGCETKTVFGHGYCASRSGLLSWLNFYCGCSPNPVTSGSHAWICSGNLASLGEFWFFEASAVTMCVNRQNVLTAKMC